MSLMYKNIILESVDLTQYNDEDFVEVFVMEFRPWIKKNHGDEVGEYPMSLLVNKYMKEFSNDLDVDPISYRYGDTLRKMRDIGREIVKKGVRQLPSLSKNYMFTEKFKKAVEYFISSYDLPEFVKVHFEELSPFRVRGWLELDFEQTMKYEGDIKEVHRFAREIINFVTSYLGFEIGSPAHGKIDFVFHSSVNFTGVEEWVKNVLNKKIKKEIKDLPNRDSLRSMKFEANTNGIRGDINLIYNRNSWFTNRMAFKNSFREYLKDLGYSPNRLTVNDN